MNAFLILNSILLLSIIVLNLYYFFKLRQSKYKWIKLIYASSAFIVLWMLFNKTVNLLPQTAHLGEVTLLVITLFAGSLVSYTKMYAGGYSIVEDTKSLIRRGKSDANRLE